MRAAAWGEKLVRHSRVFRPEGEGPFPTALLFHGCGGKARFLEAYAATAVARGWAAVVVDSLAPRGLSLLDARLTVCTGLRLHGAKRAADVFAMLAWLQGQAWADAGRVFLAGWSHGGWTVMDAYALGERAARITGLSDADPAALRRAVKGALLVYPYAGYPALTARRGWGEDWGQDWGEDWGGGRPRVWSVLAGKDQVVGWKAPKLALDRLARDGLTVDQVFHPDATHAFDDDQANDPRSRHRPDLFEAMKTYLGEALTACA